MLINDLYTNKTPNLSEGMENQVIFSGTGADGSKYEIIQSGPTDFMIHANGRHIDTYGSLQRAMSVLQNEVPGLQQGVAEAQTDYQKRRQRERDVDAGKPVKPAPKNPQNDYFARRKKEKDLAEDDDAVAAFMARGGEIQRLKPAKPRKGERWQGSSHIGSATGRGNTKGRVSGLGANTGKTAKPVVTAEDSAPTHRIGLTVTDPNHPMVSKRKEAYQKSVRVTGHDKEKAINSAIAHHKRKGYQVHDHHYMGTVAEGIDIDPALAAVAKKYPSAHISKDGKVIQKPVDRPYTPPQQDAEKQQRDLTAKYPNIDQLVADAERSRDPYYDRAEGNAYYAGREAEQNYQKLKQIQRVIQGLNESRKKLDEFNPFSKKKVDTTSPTTEPQATGGMKFDLMGRPYKPAPVTPNYGKSVADYSNITMNAPAASVPNTKSMMPTNMMPSTATAPVAKPVGTATPLNPYQVTTARTTATPAAAPKTAMTTTNAPGFSAGTRARSSAAPELQTIDAPAQLTGPAQAKQLGMADPNVTDVIARAPTAKRAPVADIPALPAPAAPTTPNYSRGVTGYGNTTMNAPTASVPNTKSMQPANMMPTTTTAPVVKTPVATPKSTTPAAVARPIDPRFPNGKYDEVTGEATPEWQAELDKPINKGVPGWMLSQRYNIDAATPVTAPLANTTTPANELPGFLQSKIKGQKPQATGTTTRSMPQADRDKMAAGLKNARKKMASMDQAEKAAIEKMKAKNSNLAKLLAQDEELAESLTWSRNFDPGRSLYKKMKQDR